MVAQPAPSRASGSPEAHAPERFRVAIEFAVTGDLRFLSHHDELRLLARALVRARWPLAYSHGFNPRSRLTVPLPRSVGTASECQLALTDLRQPRTPAELFDSLARQLPPGCRLERVIAPVPRLTPHAQRVTYQLDLDRSDASSLPPRLARLRALPALPIRRDYGPDKAPRHIDIRPYIDRIDLDGCQLRMELRFHEQRSARPSEVITELGLAAESYNHRLRRAGVQWDTELLGPAVGPAARERNQLGNEEEKHRQESGNHA